MNCHLVWTERAVRCTLVLRRHFGLLNSAYTVLDTLPDAAKWLVLSAVLPHVGDLEPSVADALLAYCRRVNCDDSAAEVAECILSLHSTVQLPHVIAFPEELMDDGDGGLDDVAPPGPLGGVGAPAGAPSAATVEPDAVDVASTHLVTVAMQMCSAACAPADGHGPAQTAPIPWCNLTADAAAALAPALAKVLVDAARIGALQRVCDAVDLAASGDVFTAGVVEASLQCGMARASLQLLLQVAVLPQVRSWPLCCGECLHAVTLLLTLPSGGRLIVVGS